MPNARWLENPVIVKRLRALLPTGREDEVLGALKSKWGAGAKEHGDDLYRVDPEVLLVHVVLEALDILNYASVELDRIDKTFLGSTGERRKILGRRRSMFERFRDLAAEILRESNYTEYTLLARTIEVEQHIKSQGSD